MLFAKAVDAILRDRKRDLDTRADLLVAANAHTRSVLAICAEARDPYDCGRLSTRIQHSSKANALTAAITDNEQYPVRVELSAEKVRAQLTEKLSQEVDSLRGFIQAETQVLAKFKSVLDESRKILQITKKEDNGGFLSSLRFFTYKSGEPLASSDSGQTGGLADDESELRATNQVYSDDQVDSGGQDSQSGKDVESLKNYDEEIRNEIRSNIKDLDQIVDELLRQKEEPITEAEVDIIFKSIELYRLEQQGAE